MRQYSFQVRAFLFTTLTLAIGCASSAVGNKAQKNNDTKPNEVIENLCGDSRQELGKIVNKQGVLVACGVHTNGKEADIEISFQRANHDPQIVFTSDDAFKSYRFKNKGTEFFLEEGSNSYGGFKPFLGLKISCDGKSCLAKDYKCLWVKSKEDLKKAKDTIHFWTVKRNDAKHLETRISDLFDLTLDGDKKALAVFQKKQMDLNGDASAEEMWATYSGDVRRLAKLNCL